MCLTRLHFTSACPVNAYAYLSFVTHLLHNWLVATRRSPQLRRKDARNVNIMISSVYMLSHKPMYGTESSQENAPRILARIA